MAVGAQLAEQTRSLAQLIPAAWQTVQSYLDRIALGGPVEEWISRLGSRQRIMPSLGRLAASVGNGIVVVPMGGIYLAAQPKLYTEGLLKLIPAQNRALAAEALEESGGALGLWLKGRLVSMALVGLLTWLGLSLIGVPSALSLALLSGLLEFIPFFGPIIGSIPAVLIAFGSSPQAPTWTALLYLFVQQLEGKLLGGGIHSGLMSTRRNLQLPVGVGCSGEPIATRCVATSSSPRWTRSWRSLLSTTNCSSPISRRASARIRAPEVKRKAEGPVQIEGSFYDDWPSRLPEPPSYAGSIETEYRGRTSGSGDRSQHSLLALCLRNRACGKLFDPDERGLQGIRGPDPEPAFQITGREARLPQRDFGRDIGRICLPSRYPLEPTRLGSFEPQAQEGNAGPRCHTRYGLALVDSGEYRVGNYRLAGGDRVGCEAVQPIVDPLRAFSGITACWKTALGSHACHPLAEHVTAQNARTGRPPDAAAKGAGDRRFASARKTADGNEARFDRVQQIQSESEERARLVVAVRGLARPFRLGGAHMGPDRGAERQEQWHESDPSLVNRRKIKIAVEDDIGFAHEAAPPEVHQQEGEIVKHVRGCQFGAEFQAVERRRLTVDQRDVGKMKIAVAMADTASHCPLVEKRSSAVQQHDQLPDQPPCPVWAEPFRKGRHAV